MQIKIFTIPIIGGEQAEGELNAFLRSKRILKTEKGLVGQGDAAVWSFCVTYLTGNEASHYNKIRKEKPDYKRILDEDIFQLFSQFRSIRKELSVKEGVPAYAVFTDAELVEIAKLGKNSTLAKIGKIQGIGKSKIEKYAHYFVFKNEKNRESNP